MTAQKCAVCKRDAERMNGPMSECSHIDCQHRRKAWSERPTASELFRGPWAAKGKDADPLPLDKVIGCTP